VLWMPSPQLTERRERARESERDSEKYMNRRSPYKAY
jgi:hypothetical protein